MGELAAARAGHVKDCIVGIRSILEGKTFEEARAETVVWLAFERYLQILSEASRHIPASWKTQFGRDLPWQNIADLGNVLRHAYDRANAAVYWSIHENDLDPLEAAIDAMLAAHGQPGAGA